MTFDANAILPIVTALARGAGDIMLRHFAAPIPTTSKTSRIDIVTAADTEVEGYLVGELSRYFPAHHIVGEEGGGQGAALAGAGAADPRRGECQAARARNAQVKGDKRPAREDCALVRL